MFDPILIWGKFLECKYMYIYQLGSKVQTLTGYLKNDAVILYTFIFEYLLYFVSFCNSIK